MVLTHEKTETQQELREGFSTKPVAKSYFAPLFEADQDQEPLFEVEKEYNGFDVSTEKPKNPILPEFEVLPKQVTMAQRQEKEEQKDVQMRLSARGKIIAIASSLVFVLLLTMVIYNAVILGAKAKEVALLADQVSTKQEQVEELRAVLASTQTEENVNEFLAQNASLLRKATNADKIYVSASYVEVEEIAVPTNWFDKICEFLSNLF